MKKPACGAASGPVGDDVLWNRRLVFWEKLRKVDREKAALKEDCWNTGRAARKRVVVAGIAGIRAFAERRREERVGQSEIPVELTGGM